LERSVRLEPGQSLDDGWLEATLAAFGYEQADRVTEPGEFAAAIVALAGYQVAVAAPTTLLGRQHLDTVRRRLSGAGLRIAPLLRGARLPESREVLRSLARARPISSSARIQSSLPGSAISA
jgi:transcription-repair coupling factor (superfamily II helicase)